MAVRPYYRVALHLLSLTILLLPGVVWGSTAEETAATNFVPLVGIPYVQGEKVATFGDYVNAFYYASISIAAFLAVVRIIFAGVKYMLTDIVTKKGDAKNDIRSALFGLLIVVGAVLILNTINTNLTEIKLFSNAPSPGVEGREDRISAGPSTPLADEQATCRARGTGYELVITRTVPAGKSIRDTVMTTECCPAGGCPQDPTSTSTDPNASTIIVLFEYPKENLDGLDTSQRQGVLNLWQKDCETTKVHDAKDAARFKEIQNHLPAGTLASDIAVVFVQENSPERYTCVQRSSG